MHRRALLWFVAFGALATASCLSPTLPLPPPEPPELVHLKADGGWDISGTCLAGSLVTIFNEQTGKGVVVEDRDNNGNYRIDIDGTACDLLWIAQDLGSESSARTSFVLQERTSAGIVDPSECIPR